MKKCILILIIIILGFRIKSNAFELIWQDIGGGNLNLKTVLVNTSNSRFIYIGSDNGIFKTEDGGKTYRNILSIRGQKGGVNFLLFDPGDKNSLYAATGNGLFYSSNQGESWNRIFRGKNYLENECICIAVLPYSIYLGTKNGLFISKDKGKSWHKESGKLGNSYILAIASNFKEPDYIYVACLDGVFKTKDRGQSWEKIFVTSPTEDGNDIEEESEDQDEEKQSSDIRYISIDPQNYNYLYLATSKGVYKSLDRGGSWELLSSYGLLNQDVRFLLLSNKSELFVITKSGIFKYRNERWEELSLRLIAGQVRFLTLDNQDNLYAACDKGLFKAKIKFDNKSQDDIIAIYYKNEPGIKEVQQAAIKYAEVEPEKISRWRRQAARRALLPKLTIEMDRDKNRTISKSIWGTYSSYSNSNITAPGRYYIGPDDETRYNNKNWSVSLTWELGDLIFSDDQTNIDVRSRLMVQLRDDILDEVTRLYFERIRIKMELDSLSLEDRKKRFEKELRLKELTAHLDGLTGGYFSSHLSN